MSTPPSSHKPGFRAPTSTFFGATRADVDQVREGTLAFVGMPSDATHSSRVGTRFGPRALRQESTRLVETLRAAGTEGLYDTRSGRRLRLREAASHVDLGDARIDPLDVGATTRAITDLTGAIADRGGLPVAIGGDHYNGYPAALGVSESFVRRRPGQRIGFIQVDGHLDFGDRLAAWGAFNHATNARRVSELPNFDLARMVWIGIAGWVDGKDVEEIEQAGGLIFSAEDVHRIGAAEVARRALAHVLQGSDHVYLSLDIDALDAGFLPGTGSVVHSELTPRQYLDLLTVFSAAPLCGVDLVEVSPPLDPSGRSERIAARLLMEVLRERLFEHEASGPAGESATVDPGAAAAEDPP
jgi:agmatinase